LDGAKHVFTPDQYQLLDFGQGRKLERFGPWVLDRPSPAAEAVRMQDQGLWRQADARFERREEDAGSWQTFGDLPDRWTVAHGTMRFEISLTPFGHVGLFPEQAGNWNWLAEQLETSSRPLRLLNLFAYTGGSTLAAAAGAEVVHVDSSRSAVAWARRNAALSGLETAPIRWIVEDAMKFVRRELRRGNRYDGFILDPPSYGHGPAGETWQVDEHLEELIERCIELTGGTPKLALATCHSPGWPGELLAKCLPGATPGELELVTPDGRRLQSGHVARLGSSPQLSPRVPGEGGKRGRALPDA
jgi:23S rRNA (cytosine1962-C5)-methyltransferase